MKAVLAAVNAKYIHSNPAVYSLRAYAQAQGAGGEVEIGEYTINHRREDVLRDLFQRSPQLVGFSCYIWNISMIRALIADLALILPDTAIWLGGPEVSFDCGRLLGELPQVKGIMRGEGEETFTELLKAYEDQERRGGRFTELPDSILTQIPGLTFREKEGRICETQEREFLELDRIPFYYTHIPKEQMEHRIVYYESSRGCPFSCAYCLSSVEKGLRFRSLEKVFEELDWLIKQETPQVKFVDRTFNCKKSRALAIWKYIMEKDRGITNFHFEIAADLLDEEELSLLEAMRPGLVQLEIGVQSTNQKTLKAIRRVTDLEKIRSRTERINRSHNIHQHLDLIAGLPYEDFASFQNSFNQVYGLKPDQLQLGFLKVLKGSPMAAEAAGYGIVSSPNPPYEVLSTPWISHGQLLKLKQVEEMVEVYYNSRQFTHTLKRLLGEFPSPYEMFSALARFYEEKGLDQVSHSRTARYEILWSFLSGLEDVKGRLEDYRDDLMIDLYLRENAKSRPSFAREQALMKKAAGALLAEQAGEPQVLKEYRQMDSRQRARLFHMEAVQGGGFVLFDYRTRDPLSYNGAVYPLGRIKQEEGR